jgi:hypothetical protein
MDNAILAAVVGMWLVFTWPHFRAGTLFAVLLANYWIADEISPYVR